MILIDHHSIENVFYQQNKKHQHIFLQEKSPNTLECLVFPINYVWTHSRVMSWWDSQFQSR